MDNDHHQQKDPFEWSTAMLLSPAPLDPFGLSFTDLSSLSFSSESELSSSSSSSLSLAPSSLSLAPSSSASSSSSSSESIASPNSLLDVDPEAVSLNVGSFSTSSSSASASAFPPELDLLPSEDELFELMCGVHAGIASSLFSDIPTTSTPTAVSLVASAPAPAPAPSPSPAAPLTQDPFPDFQIDGLESLWNPPGVELNQNTHPTTNVSPSEEVPSFILSYLSHHAPDQDGLLGRPSDVRSDAMPGHNLEASIPLTNDKKRKNPSSSSSSSSPSSSLSPLSTLPSLAVPLPLTFDPALKPAPPSESSPGSTQSTSIAPSDPDASTDSTLASTTTTTTAGSKQPTDHNAIERKYRDNINDGFTRLRDSVPVLRALFKTSTPITLPLDTPSAQTGLIDGMAPETKQGKATVLGAAREYILQLQRERARLKRYSHFLESRLGSSAWEEFLAADSRAVLDPYLQSITTPTQPSLRPSHRPPAGPPIRSQPASAPLPSSLIRSPLLPLPPPAPPRKKARVTAAVKPRRTGPQTITPTTAATAGAVGGGTVMLVLGLGVGLFNPFDPSYSVDKNPGAGVVKGKVILGTHATPSSDLQSTPPPLSFAAPTCLCISIVVLLLMLLVVSRSARRRFHRGVSRWTKLVVRGTGNGFPGEDEEAERSHDRLPVGWVELEGGHVGGWVGWGWKANEKESYEWIGWGDRELVFSKPIVAAATVNHPLALTHTHAHAHVPAHTHPNIHHIYPARPLPVPLPDPRSTVAPSTPPDPVISHKVSVPVSAPLSIDDPSSRPDERRLEPSLVDPGPSNG